MGILVDIDTREDFAQRVDRAGVTVLDCTLTVRRQYDTDAVDLAIDYYNTT